MISILIVDDIQSKQRNIKEAIDTIADYKDNFEINTAMDAAEAKRITARKNIDILILDIQIPQHSTDYPEKDGGIRLLKDIKESRRYTYPKYVISLSEFAESTDIFKRSEGNVHTVINYEKGTDGWKIKLIESIKIFATIVSNNVLHRNYEYDIAVICALEEEIEEIKESLIDVKELEVAEDDEIYYEGYYYIEDRKVKVVFASANQMGMVAATSLTTKMIYNFIPKYFVMTGIAAGTSKDDMNYGDVVLATTAWDYRSGKDIRTEKESRHLNSIKPITIDTTIVNWVRKLSKDKSALTEIKDRFKGVKPNTDLKVWIGSVVSGASVVTDIQIVDDILKGQSRDIKALEMEIYGVYYAANWAINPRPRVMALKAISDFADEHKGDQYHQYASYTSAAVFEKLAKEYLDYDL